MNGIRSLLSLVCCQLLSVSSTRIDDVRCPRSPVPMRLTIVRHGVTHENLRGIIQGHLNSNLTQTGVKQAKLLGKRLENVTFSKAFSSDLNRAKNTAKLILKSSKQQGMRSSSKFLETTVLLREKKRGIAEGKSRAEYMTLLKNGSIPGMESTLHFANRVQSFFNRVCRTIDRSSSSLRSDIENILIVAHAGYIKTLLTYLVTHRKQFYLPNVGNYKKSLQRSPGNTAITQILVYPIEHSGLPRKIQFLTVNDISHLTKLIVTKKYPTQIPL